MSPGLAMLRPLPHLQLALLALAARGSDLLTDAQRFRREARPLTGLPGQADAALPPAADGIAIVR